MSNIRFVMQPLKNPPLCSSTRHRGRQDDSQKVNQTIDRQKVNQTIDRRKAAWQQQQGARTGRQKIYKTTDRRQTDRTVRQKVDKTNCRGKTPWHVARQESSTEDTKLTRRVTDGRQWAEWQARRQKGRTVR